MNLVASAFSTLCRTYCKILRLYSIRSVNGLCIWRNALLRKIEKCIVIPRLCKLRIVHVLLSKTSIENLDVIDKKNTYFQCIVLPVILNGSGLESFLVVLSLPFLNHVFCKRKFGLKAKVLEFSVEKMIIVHHICFVVFQPTNLK